MGDVVDIVSQKRLERQLREDAEAAKEAVLAPKGVVLSQQVAAEVVAEPLLKYFAFSDRMPKELCDMVEAYANMATAIAENLQRSAERTVTLRKLLESKDAAVRCLIDQLQGEKNVR